jgi:hypothetical protein
MKKIRIAALFMILSTVFAASAQNEMDALRYSFTELGGTARFSSMGGAFGALGGDFSALSINPAGIGVFRSSEITITPSIGYHGAESSFYGTFEDDLKYSFNLNNIGVVFTIPTRQKSENGGWQFVNLGFGMNRHTNFNNRWVAQGFNTNSSLMTSILEEARNEGSVSNLNDFTTGLAWDTYLLDIDDGVFFVDMPDGNVQQRMEVNSAGSIREFVASVGANYNDKLYIGASVGLPSIDYENSSIFMESDQDNLSPFFNSLTYTNKYNTNGTGFNFKIGGIVRIADFIRLGGALHTPTFFQLKDEYQTSMRSDLDLDPETYPDYTDETSFSESPKGAFEYELNTPLKAIGSLGLVFGTTGLLSFDYEYTDYTNARLRSEDYMFTSENNMIRSNLNAQHNIRVGGEFRLEPVILRAGYGYYSSPYREGINDGVRNVLSAGFGLRDRNYSLDFAYSYSFYSEDYALYMIENQSIPLPVAQRDFASSIFRLTLAWRF